jgi:cytochrome b6-f complex iron-sulfur subunit
MKRRDLIRNIVAGSVAVFVVPSALSSCEKESIDPDNGDGNGNVLTIDLADPDNSSLASAGGFLFAGSLIVINRGDGFIALSSKCTHSGCTVSYNSDNDHLPCSCHGSVFSTNGSVLNGPADAPLKSYPLDVEGDILTIELG